MKISAIYAERVYKCNSHSRLCHSNRQETKTKSPNFEGYCGKIGGILAGGAAAVGLAVFAAPVLICAGPALAAAGMIAGDKAEDEINKAMDNKQGKD